MNRPLNAENLETGVTDDGRVIAEPGYLSFLRDNGYPVLGIEELHTAASRDSDKAHLVAKVLTREKPDDHPQLDYVADECELWVCDCWAFRSGSADVTEGMLPIDSVRCKHIKSVDKVARAEDDDGQETLV